MFSTAAGTVSQMSDRLRSNRDDPTWWLLGLSSLAIADGSPPCMGIHVHTFPWLASRFRVRHGWDVQWCNLPLPDVFPNDVEVWWGGINWWNLSHRGTGAGTFYTTLTAALACDAWGLFRPELNPQGSTCHHDSRPGIMALGGIWSFGSQASKGFYVVSASSFSIWGSRTFFQDDMKAPCFLHLILELLLKNIQVFNF